MSRSAGEVARVALLLGLVAYVWCFAYARHSLEDARVPLSFGTDAILNLGCLTAARDGDFALLARRTIPRLNAPFGAHWEDFPFEDAIFVVPGLLARAIGVFEAANLAVLAAHLTAAAGAYAACRLGRASGRFAFVAALAFSLAPYGFGRGLQHLNQVFYGHVPLALVSTWWLAEGKDDRRAARLAIAALAGAGSTYYLWLYLQLVAFAGAARAARARSIRAAGPAAETALVALALFLVTRGTFLLHHARGGEGFERHYYETEIGALKPLDLVVPVPGHRLAALDRAGSWYWGEILVRGEGRAVHLGLAATAGFLWLAGSAARAALSGRGRVPCEAQQALWILAYSAVGGLNALLALGGFNYFRATNQLSVFLLALSLSFLASRLTCALRGRSRALQAAAGLAIALASLADVPPPERAAFTRDAIARNLASDRELVSSLEARLGPEAALFQLPVMEFPEAKPVGGVFSYDHLRPYVLSRTLRLSFGASRARTEGDWQREVAELPIREALPRLARLGYSGIWLDLRAYEDGGSGVLKIFRTSGLDVLSSPQGDVAVVVFRRR